MRVSTMLMAAVATLAIAAPVEKRQSLAQLLGLSGNSFDLSNLVSDFSSNSLSANDIVILLQSFDLNSFNNQFGASFNDQAILQLLLSLQSNVFGLSNFNDITNVNNDFNLGAFASLFNASFNAGWSQNEIEQLLLQLGLVNSNSFASFNSVFAVPSTVVTSVSASSISI